MSRGRHLEAWGTSMVLTNTRLRGHHLLRGFLSTELWIAYEFRALPPARSMLCKHDHHYVSLIDE